MKRTVLILILAIALAGLTMAASSSCPKKGCCSMGPQMPMGKMLRDPAFIEKLGLAPEQVAKLKKLHFEHQKKMIAFGSNLKLLKLELMNLMDAEKLDKNLIRQKVKEISAVKADVALEKVDMRLAGADMLTKEQIEKVKQMAPGCMGNKEMKCTEKKDRPVRMMKHQCLPGGGNWTEKEDRIIMLPPPHDEEEMEMELEEAIEAELEAEMEAEEEM